MMDTNLTALVWFRRDLRCTDHAALFHALKQHHKVWCVFVFDTDILSELPRQDQRVAFIHACVTELDQALKDMALAAGHPQAAHVGLIVQYGSARQVIPELAASLGVQAVYANHDDEPSSQDRDAQVRGRLSNIGVALYTLKDHVIFERHEVLTGNATPYGVFTPYKNAWLKKIEPFYVKAYPVERYAAHLATSAHTLAEQQTHHIPSLQQLGFEPAPNLKIAPGMSAAQKMLQAFLQRMDRYHLTRDLPSVRGPSYLSPHLRFGTLSIRQLVDVAWQRSQDGDQGASVWLSELIWRDFYHQILFHHPHVVEGAYKREYDAIKWAHGAKANAHFTAWCEGKTGYPLVDAAMRQLNQTGYMHNRLRMVTASFLVKDLGIHWQRGEAYFAQHLLDFDLAANNGGWQWAASTGCDAQPYFRIFNPITQSERFDPEGKFILRYVPELKGLQGKALHAPWLDRKGLIQLGKDYPAPLVQHDEARVETMARYANALDPKKSKGATLKRPR